MTKLTVERFVQDVKIDFDKPIAFIHSAHDKQEDLDPHSESLKKYLDEAGIRTEVVQKKDVMKDKAGEACDLSIERILFIGPRAMVDWMMNKYVSWLLEEARGMLGVKPEKKESPFTVRCILSFYSPEFKKVQTTVYSGDILDVMKQIGKDHHVKIRKFDDKPGDDLPRVFKLY